MKYLKLFESLLSAPIRGYKIKDKSWDYEIGYIWSPTSPTTYPYGDISVNQLPIDEDDMSDTYGLIANGLREQIRNYIGVDNKDLCIFHPRKDFNFDKYIIDKKSFKIIEDAVFQDFEHGHELSSHEFKTFEVEKLEDDYKKEIRRLLKRDISDKELEDGIIGSWGVDVKYYDINGIKAIYFDLSGDESIVIERDKVNDIVLLTDTYQYYKYEDKDNQMVRINDEVVYFYDVNDIFLSFIDHGFKLTDIDIGHELLLISFISTGTPFNKNVIEDLNYCIEHIENRYDVKISDMISFRKGYDNRILDLTHYNSNAFHFPHSSLSLGGVAFDNRSIFCIKFKNT